MVIRFFYELRMPFQMSNHTADKHTCSMTSGAIQQGVPTNVCLTVSRVKSFPVASHALTPKSRGRQIIY